MFICLLLDSCGLRDLVHAPSANQFFKYRELSHKDRYTLCYNKTYISFHYRSVEDELKLPYFLLCIVTKHSFPHVKPPL
jgi:hypothetical protein